MTLRTGGRQLDTAPIGSTARGPLSGVRILELGTNVSAPLAAMILAEQGAEVIKIEAREGDPLRRVGTQSAGTSALFANVSRGKRSVAIDLKCDEGQKIVQELAKRVDVVIHNFRRGVMDRLNLSSQELRAGNPRLIYLSVSGYGTEGPLADQPAYDPIMQALSGYTDVQGLGHGRQFINSLVCDKITAYTASQAITAALYERTTTGVGQEIDLSMLEASLYFLWPDGMANHTYCADGIVAMAPIASVFQKYAVLDGEITIAAASNEHWRAVFQLIGRPELIEDPRYRDLAARYKNASNLNVEISAGLSRIKSANAIEALQKNGVGCAPLQSLEELIQHPQVAAVSAIERHEHEKLGVMNLVKPPARFNGEQSRLGRDCPMIGEHTSDVLSEIGYAIQDIEKLSNNGVVWLGDAV